MPLGAASSVSMSHSRAIPAEARAPASWPARGVAPLGSGRRDWYREARLRRQTLVLRWSGILVAGDVRAQGPHNLEQPGGGARQATEQHARWPTRRSTVRWSISASGRTRATSAPDSSAPSRRLQRVRLEAPAGESTAAPPRHGRDPDLKPQLAQRLRCRHDHSGSFSGKRSVNTGPYGALARRSTPRGHAERVPVVGHRLNDLRPGRPGRKALHQASLPGAANNRTWSVASSVVWLSKLLRRVDGANEEL
jgi:hypothetical protein